MILLGVMVALATITFLNSRAYRVKIKEFSGPEKEQVL